MTKGLWHGMEVAVKMLKDTGDEAEFRHEALMMCQIPPHPNVLSLVGFVTKKPPYLLLTEYVKGGSLAMLLGSQKPITTGLVQELLLGIGHGLIHLHAQNVVVSRENQCTREKTAKRKHPSSPSLKI